MEIQLPEVRERFVRSLLEDGRYTSEDEVIEAALQSLQERADQADLAELRREVAIGIEQADRGELGRSTPPRPWPVFARGTRPIPDRLVGLD